MSSLTEICNSRSFGGFFHFAWDESERNEDGTRPVLFTILPDEGVDHPGNACLISVPIEGWVFSFGSRLTIGSAEMLENLANRIQLLEKAQYQALIKSIKLNQISFRDLRALITILEYGRN